MAAFQAKIWAERLSLMVLMSAGVFALPGIILGLSTLADLGTVRPGLDWPLFRAIPHWNAIGSETLLGLPFIEIDLARGLPIARSYAVTPLQGALSLALAALMSAVLHRHLTGAAHSGRASWLIALSLGLAAMSPGLLGHCAGDAQAGGLFMSLGMSPSLGAMLTWASPFIQTSLMIITAIFLWTSQPKEESPCPSPVSS